MEISVDTLITIASLFIGGGGGAFFTWRWQRAKAKAEAQTAEVNMAKEVQDIYQQALADKDKELLYYKKDGEEQRNRLDQMEAKVRGLQEQVARNGRMVESLRPFICTDLGCKRRQRGIISGDVVVEENRNNRRDNYITP